MFRIILLVALLGATHARGQAPVASHEQALATLEAAQAAAARPGDEALDCDALQDELVGSAQDPAFQAYVATHGEKARQEIEASRPGSREMAAQAALTMFSSIAPGGAWVGHAAAVTQAESQRAQAASNIQQRMQAGQDFMQFAPMLMRGQRVIELAQARGCAWAEQAMGE